MIVICPKCGLNKDLGVLNIPSGGANAQCPRCGMQFLVRPDVRTPGVGLKRTTIIASAVCILFIIILLSSHDGNLDKDYYLQPGAWQGDMTFRGKKHPFGLVIEKAQDGRLWGYMDWVGSQQRYRLAIRGSYVGNHLIFEDYAFLEGSGAVGLHDEQNVYIVGNEMIGTAKNGDAELHATKRASTPF